MKSFVPVVLALFGAALAAPVATEAVESAKNPDILYFMPVGWGKRSEQNAEKREVIIEARSAEAAEENVQANANPDILYFMPVGWGKRSADDA